MARGMTEGSVGSIENPPGLIQDVHLILGLAGRTGQPFRNFAIQLCRFL